MIVGDDRVHSDLPVEVLAAVHHAAAEACTTKLLVPAFGSWAWCQLPEDSPARGYATVRAAWAWWLGMYCGSGVPASVLDREVAARLAAASRDVHGGDREHWRRLANRPTREEIERRRAELGPMARETA